MRTVMFNGVMRTVPSPSSEDKKVAVKLFRTIVAEKEKEMEYLSRFEPDNKEAIDSTKYIITNFGARADELEEDIKINACDVCGVYAPEDVKERHQYGISVGFMCGVCASKVQIAV